MKKKYYLVTAVVAIIIVATAGFIISKPHEPIKEIKSTDELLKIVGDEKISYIYIGRPSCEDCESFVPILKTAAEDFNKTVKYYNTDNHHGDSEYDDVIARFKVVWVPALYKVGNGEIIDALSIQFKHTADEKTMEMYENDIRDFHRRIWCGSI